MGVDDEVWHNALTRERHVFLRVRDSHRPLLPMPRCKLVANLRNPDCACADLDKLGVAVGRACHHDLINHTVLMCLEMCGAVCLGLLLCPACLATVSFHRQQNTSAEQTLNMAHTPCVYLRGCTPVYILTNTLGLAYKSIFANHPRSWGDKTVIVQLVVVCMRHARTLTWVRLLYALKRRVSPVPQCSPCPPLLLILHPIHTCIHKSTAGCTKARSQQSK